jgi:hypothetical protein
MVSLKETSMKPSFPAHNHECCPKEWRATPDMSGSYELDASILRSKNKDVPARLKLFLENESAYGPRTGYDGYHNYSGDT